MYFVIHLYCTVLNLLYYYTKLIVLCKVIHPNEVYSHALLLFLNEARDSREREVARPWSRAVVTRLLESCRTSTKQLRNGIDINVNARAVFFYFRRADDAKLRALDLLLFHSTTLDITHQQLQGLARELKYNLHCRARACIDGPTILNKNIRETKTRRRDSGSSELALEENTRVLLFSSFRIIFFSCDPRREYMRLKIIRALPV